MTDYRYSKFRHILVNNTVLWGFTEMKLNNDFWQYGFHVSICHIDAYNELFAKLKAL